jgi:hypothetical protein
LADKSRHRLPRSIHLLAGDGHFECFLSGEV